MKRLTVILSVFFTAALLAPGAYCAGDKDAGAGGGLKDPNRIFYGANAFYEKKEYDKAIEEYLKILDGGLESGSLYYNIGNSFLKLNKPGYAIYCYEKAKRLAPGDSDLKSNLSYARSLAGTVDYPESALRAALRRAFYPMRQMTLNGAAALTLSLYILTVLLSAFFIANRMLVKRYGFILYILIAVSVYCILAFGIKYYHEMVLKFGIVVEKDVECRYEPIDKSTTYFMLPEGDKVVVVRTRNGWRQIKRLDGRVGWVGRDSVQEI